MLRITQDSVFCLLRLHERIPELGSKGSLTAIGRFFTMRHDKQHILSCFQHSLRFSIQICNHRNLHFRYTFRIDPNLPMIAEIPNTQFQCRRHRLLGLQDDFLNRKLCHSPLWSLCVPDFFIQHSPIFFKQPQTGLSLYLLLRIIGHHRCYIQYFSRGIHKLVKSTQRYHRCTELPVFFRCDQSLGIKEAIQDSYC